MFNFLNNTGQWWTFNKAVEAFVSRWLIRRPAKPRPDPEWAAAVQRALSFLFTEHGATLADSTYDPGSFGARTAVIKVGNLILRVSRDATLPRDYIESRIAPVNAPSDFKPSDFKSPVNAWMALALMADGAIPPTPPYKEFALQGLSKFLRQNFIHINEAYSVANYPVTKEKIIEVEQERWRQWNRGLIR